MKKILWWLTGLILSANMLSAMPTISELDTMSDFHFAIISDNKGYDDTIGSDPNDALMAKMLGWIKTAHADTFCLGVGDHHIGTRTRFAENTLTNDSWWHTRFYPIIGDHDNDCSLYYGVTGLQTDWGRGYVLFNYTDMYTRSGVTFRPTQAGQINSRGTLYDDQLIDWYAVRQEAGFNVHIIGVHFGDQSVFADRTRAFMMQKIYELGATKTDHDIIIVLGHSNGVFFENIKQAEYIETGYSRITDSEIDDVMMTADLVCDASVHKFYRHDNYDGNYDGTEALWINTGITLDAGAGYVEIHVFDDPPRFTMQYMDVHLPERQIHEDVYVRHSSTVTDAQCWPVIKQINGPFENLDWDTFDPNDYTEYTELPIAGSSSSGAQVGYEAYKSHDGIVEDDQRFSDSGGAGSWIQWDLGSDQTIDMVKLALFKNSLDRQYPLKLEVDGNQIWTGTTTPERWTRLMVPSVTGRYVKLTMTGQTTDNSPYFGIQEVRIMSESEILPPEDPVVEFTSPANDITLDEGDDLTVTVSATDPDGITQVEFLKGTTSLGVDTTAPYEWTLNNLQVETFTLTARATDTLSNTGEDSIAVTVEEPSVVGDVLLAVDFHQNLTDPVPATPDYFTGWFVGNVSAGVAAPSTNINGYGVTLGSGATIDCLSTAASQTGMNARNRSAGYILNAGAFTQEDMMRERIGSLVDPAADMTVGTGNGLYLKVTGLTADTPYFIQAWGVDSTGAFTNLPVTLKNGSCYGFDATGEQAGYSSLPQLGTYTVAGSPTSIADNDQYSVSGTIIADSSGTLIYKQIADIDRSIINGFILAEVNTVTSGYDNWASTNGITGGPLDDDDGDGLDNLSEYAVSEKPVLTESGSAFELIYKQRNDDPNLSYELQTVSDLLSGAWTNTGYTILGTNITGGLYDDVTNAIPADDPQSYIRLKIENQ